MVKKHHLLKQRNWDMGTHLLIEQQLQHLTPTGGFGSCSQGFGGLGEGLVSKIGQKMILCPGKF